MPEEVVTTNPEVNAEIEGANVEPVTPNYYTVDEMKEAGLNLDVDRVPPELQGFAKDLKKSLQGDYTRKTQAVAEAAKQFQNAQTPQMTPEQQIFQEFIRNPKGVLDAIEGRMDILDSVDPFDTDNYKAARAEMRKLNKVKDDLILKRQQAIEMEVVRDKQLRAMKKEGLDIESRFSELLEVAREEGFSDEEFNLYTQDKRFAKVMAKLAETKKAKQSVKDKEVKTPPNVVTPGTGMETVSTGNLKNLEKKALESGTPEAWAEYFDEKTRIATRNRRK